tara:strand:+ start:3068 stop:3343 length:276 start_codon:yes stop_codon:yes gene_type:complete
MSNKIRHVSAKYDTTVHWDLEDIAETANFDVNDIVDLSVNKWVELQITLKDDRVICIDGEPNGDNTDWKWSTKDLFYDKDFNKLDYQLELE